MAEVYFYCKTHVRDVRLCLAHTEGDSKRRTMVYSKGGGKTNCDTGNSVSSLCVTMRYLQQSYRILVHLPLPSSLSKSHFLAVEDYCHYD